MKRRTLGWLTLLLCLASATHAVGSSGDSSRQGAAAAPDDGMQDSDTGAADTGAADTGAAANCGDEAEMRILQALRERRLDLERRERAVRARELVVEKLEKTLSERMDAVFTELRTVEKKLLVGDAARGAHDRRIESLVSAVRALSPRKAAPMVASTQQDLAVELLIRLGPEHAASLLGVMQPAAAAQLIEAMAIEDVTNPATGSGGTTAGPGGKK